MTNDAQLPMMKNMLNSALKAGFPMSWFHCYILDSQKNVAHYGTHEFKSITITKLEVILQNLLLDKEVIWIDNDIVLFQNIIPDLLKYNAKFVIQDDLWGYCTGFFLVRNSQTSVSILEKSIEWLKSQHGNGMVNDQHAFNHVCKQTMILSNILITKLPQDEYPNGEIYFNQNRRSRAKMVHCNYLAKTSDKIQRFKDYNMWDESDIGFNLTNRYLI